MKEALCVCPLSPQVQQQFSSSRGVATFDAFAVSGTLPHVSWDERSEVINYCPELKTIFPSLRESKNVLLLASCV
jgi:hypothetical protein